MPWSRFCRSGDEHEHQDEQQIEEKRRRTNIIRRSSKAADGDGGRYRGQARQASETNSDPGGARENRVSHPVPRRDLPSITPVAFWRVVSGGPAPAGGSAGPGAREAQTSSEAASQAMAVLPRAAGGSLTATRSPCDAGGLVPFLESAHIDTSSSTYTYLVIMRHSTCLRVV